MILILHTDTSTHIVDHIMEPVIPIDSMALLRNVCDTLEIQPGEVKSLIRHQRSCNREMAMYGEAKYGFWNKWEEDN